MKKEEAVSIIILGKAGDWNSYRKLHPEWIPDLSDVDISSVNLCFPIPFDLSKANLCGSKLPEQRSSYVHKPRRLGIAARKSRSGKTRLKKVILRDAIFDTNTTYGKNVNLSEFGAVYISQHDPQNQRNHPPLIFISYAWANEEIVLAVDYWLRSKNLPTKIDKRDFFAGSRIRDEIMRVMKECDVILVFYSEVSRDKPWTEFERELANDLEIEAKREGKKPPRIIYLVIDDTLLPTISEKNRIAIMAKGKRFELVCEEIYHNILQIPKIAESIELEKWKDFVF